MTIDEFVEQQPAVETETGEEWTAAASAAPASSSEQLEMMQTMYAEMVRMTHAQEEQTKLLRALLAKVGSMERRLTDEVLPNSRDIPAPAPPQKRQPQRQSAPANTRRETSAYCACDCDCWQNYESVALGGETCDCNCVIPTKDGRGRKRCGCQMPDGNVVLVKRGENKWFWRAADDLQQSARSEYDDGEEPFA